MSPTPDVSPGPQTLKAMRGQTGLGEGQPAQAGYRVPPLMCGSPGFAHKTPVPPPEETQKFDIRSLWQFLQDSWWIRSTCSHLSITREFWNKARNLNKCHFCACIPWISSSMKIKLCQESFSCVPASLNLEQNGTVKGKLFNLAHLLRKNKIVCFLLKERTEKGINIFCFYYPCFYDMEPYS